MTADILGNEITKGDFVISYNHLYQVLGVSQNYARIILVDKSKTTRALNRYRLEMVVVSSLMKEQND